MPAEQYFWSLCIFIPWCLITLTNSCRLTYVNKPSIDYKCVSNTLSDLEIWHSTGLPQCQWRCLTIKQCHFLNYNASSGQCELGFRHCVSLWPALGVWGNAYGSTRNACLQWRSDQPTGLMPVGKSDGGGAYVARVVIGQALVIGKFMVNGGRMYANNENTAVDLLYDVTLGHELLMVDPICPLSWMQYTPYTEIPSWAVLGGHMADGSPTYVVKVHHVHHGKSNLVPGYYSPKTGLAYFDFIGPKTSTDMMILIVLWHFEIVLYRYYLPGYQRTACNIEQQFCLSVQ